MSLLLKVITLKFEKNIREAKPTNYTIKFYLIDCRPRAENQIVSNVYSSPFLLQNNRLLPRNKVYIFNLKKLQLSIIK